jgi:hypothetical protein
VAGRSVTSHSNRSFIQRDRRQAASVVGEPKARWNGSLIALSGGACGAAFALVLSTMLVKNAAEFLYFNF